MSGEATEKTLRHYASKVRDQLMALDGITQVELANVRDMEISIEISEDTLRRHGMTFDEGDGDPQIVGPLARRLDQSRTVARFSCAPRARPRRCSTLNRSSFAPCRMARLRLAMATPSTGLRKTTGNHTSMVVLCAGEGLRVGDENAIEISDIVTSRNPPIYSPRASPSRICRTIRSSRRPS